MKSIIHQDLKSFCTDFQYKDNLRNSKFLITGVTGLIGSNLVRCLLSLKVNIHICAPVRGIERAKSILREYADSIELIESRDLLDIDYAGMSDIDYIVHCAAPTASKYFVDYPVETISSIIDSTSKLLEAAKKMPLRGFVYLSSIEVYGQVNSDKKITEHEQYYIDPMDIRSSYPMAKRMAENLCCSYAGEYNIPVSIVRLTQTTGPGIAKSDNRIIAQFTRAAVKGEDIVLHTTGESARPYCYTMDAITAILYVLIFGKKGKAYNVAQDESYISARDLALLIKKEINPAINVNFILKDDMGYAPPSKINLCTNALKSLGWKPKYEIRDIIIYLSKYIREIDG